MSALSLGPSGWIQMLNLIGFGVVILLTVPTWRRILHRGKGNTAYPQFTALVGVSFIILGIIRQDPAPGYDPANLRLTAPTGTGLTHIAVAGVAALSSVAGLIVMASRFRGDPAWPGWTLASWAAAVVVVGCVVVYGVWSVRSTGFAGTFERGAMIVPLLWLYAFLQQLTRGTPFMAAPRTASDATL